MIKINTSTMNMEAVCSSEMSEPAYQSTQCHNPEDHNKNIKFDFKEIGREGINWIQMA
jgi:hypothetical protein